MSKSESYNAGLITRILRAHFGLLMFAGLWAFWGWAVWGVSLAFALGAWVLFLGPLFFMLLLVLRQPILHKNIFRLNLRQHPSVLKQSFAMILEASGPNLQFFVIPSNDKSLSWLALPFSSKQLVYVSSAWLEQEEESIRSQVQQLWFEVAHQGQAHRWMRSVEWAFWSAAFLPLDLSLRLMDIAFRFFGLRNLPSTAFWAQRLCWQIKRIWFSSRRMNFSDEGPLFQRLSQQNQNFKTPKAWESLVWGVWTRLVPDSLHPSWAVLTDSDAFFRRT